jgi:hypothetical protein
MIPSGGVGALAAAFASGDYSSITKKLREEGGDKLKDVEATAERLKAKYQEITKDGKGSLEEAIKSLKDVQGEDLDKVLKQAKGELFIPSLDLIRQARGVCLLMLNPLLLYFLQTLPSRLVSLPT